jgi:hypothetical protein
LPGYVTRLLANLGAVKLTPTRLLEPRLIEPVVGIEWPADLELTASAKDSAAPPLAELTGPPKVS